MAGEPFKNTAVGVVFLGVVSCAIWALLSGMLPDWNHPSSPSTPKETTRDVPSPGKSSAAVSPVKPQPKPVEAQYKKMPTPPVSGAIKGASVVIEECHRPDVYHIICIGELTNTTDAPEEIFLGDSTVVDDEGNSFFINGIFEGAGGFTLGEIANGTGGGGGAFEPFMPGVATKFSTHVKDDHQNVRSVSLMLGFHTKDGHCRLTFPNIAVQ